jgi:hypothetical protein
MGDETQRYARVPAATGRAGWQRTSPHTATAGQLEGRGASQAAALADLGSKLEAMAGRAAGEPSVWWDADNAVLWVAVPDAAHGGHHAYPVKFPDGTQAPSRSVCVTSGAADAADALRNCIGIAEVRKSARPANC